MPPGAAAVGAPAGVKIPLFHVKHFEMEYSARPGAVPGRDFFLPWTKFANFLLKSLAFVLY